MSIIQWNIQGLPAKRENLEILISQHDPNVICLQETQLKENANIRNYQSFSKTSLGTDGRAKWGVSLLIQNTTPHQHIPLNTELQAIAAQVTLNRTVTVCSIYIPPGQFPNPRELEDLCSQLPKPYFLLGDYNAHSIAWGDDKSDSAGNKLQNFIQKNDLIFMNDGSKTRVDPASRVETAIDLSICDPNIHLDFSWYRDQDLWDSDHFPIHIKSVIPLPPQGIPKWQLHKADWALFREKCEEFIAPEHFQPQEGKSLKEHIDGCIERFTEGIYQAAEQSIPQSSGNPKKVHRPWFTAECQDAIVARSKALKDFQRHPTQENHIHYKIRRAKARRVIRANKKRTWREYVSKMTSQSSAKKTWEMVRKISGKSIPQPIKHLKNGDAQITEKQHIVNELGKGFAENSSDKFYSKEFQKHKANSEKEKLNFKSNNTEKYNKKLTAKEVKQALRRAHNSAPGLDKIIYRFLRELPDICFYILLNIYNLIWENGICPSTWKQAIIIPIPKPGKDHTNRNNYRPIALTSCVCKTLERMINTRLVWYLEKNNLLTVYQSGFRKHRNTVDHLIRLETKIRQSFIKHEHNVSIFFDLEKAYDTTWKFGIMRDLRDLGLMGNLPIFIKNFLEDRSFQVRLGASLSGSYPQDNGVPQGSILSPTLFSIKINSITKCLRSGMNAALYVDDFSVSYSSQNIATIERQLQLCLNELEHWADENGFKFSPSKTVCVHFCRKHSCHQDPVLHLKGTQIPVVENTKFLGLFFDRRLNFQHHINYLRTKCEKALNLLRVVSSMDWGADSTTLLYLYRSLVRSKLDYGSMVYGSAPKSYLEKLKPIQNRALRICLGAFRTSPVSSLHVEANELPLHLRREKLALQYALKLKANPSNPTFQCVFEPEHENLFKLQKKAIPTFGLRMKDSLEELDANLDLVAKIEEPEIPSWLMREAMIDWELSGHLKSSTLPDTFISDFYRIRERYKGYQFIYTDGSKIEEKVAGAAVVRKDKYQFRLPNHCSIFSAELKAIDLALEHIRTSCKSKFVICTDSKSSLEALEGTGNGNILVMKMKEKIHNIQLDKTVQFMWVPSHIGIKGNDRADSAAKEALDLEELIMDVPHSDFKSQIYPYIKMKWQSEWDRENADKGNKLYAIQPEINNPKSLNMSRREEIVYRRLRIGHSHITHSYHLKGEEKPECIGCAHDFTISHVLLNCIEFADTRQRFYEEQDLKSLFENVTPSDILDFIKEIGLFYKI